MGFQWCFFIFHWQITVIPTVWIGETVFKPSSWSVVGFQLCFSCFCWQVNNISSLWIGETLFKSSNWCCVFKSVFHGFHWQIDYFFSADRRNTPFKPSAWSVAGFQRYFKVFSDKLKFLYFEHKKHSKWRFEGLFCAPIMISRWPNSNKQPGGLPCPLDQCNQGCSHLMGVQDCFWRGARMLMKN